LAVINKMSGDEYLTNAVAFHCQQLVEKSFKAVIEEYGDKLLKTHNLETLYNEVTKLISLDLDPAGLELLDSVYIEARYPVALGLLPYGKPTLKDASSFSEFAKSVFCKVCDILEPTHNLGKDGG